MKFLTIFILLFLSISCQPILSTRNSFANTQFCYTGRETGLDHIIELNGYYSFTSKYIRNVGFPAIQQEDTLLFYCVFFKDGTFLYHYFPSAGGGDWGTYVVKNNLVKGQFIEPPGGMSWTKGEAWFQIIDKRTIKQLYFKNKESITEQEVIKSHLEGKDEDTSLGKFVPYDNLPDPNKSWLKKREWFWCSKEEYKVWKKKSK